MKILAAIATAVTLMLVLAASASATVSTQVAELEFVAPDSISLTYSDETSKEVSVWVKNTGDESFAPSFSTSLENGDGERVPATVRLVDDEGKVVGPAQLGRNEVRRYRLFFEKISKSSGQLVANASVPGVTPASMDMTLGPELAVSRGVDGALLIPLGVALLVILVAWAYASKDVGLGDSLGGLELDFGKSFASSLTVVGALLGTIISAGVLPEETVNLSKAGFTGLNLTFGIAIVFAGIVYAAAQKKVVDEKGKDWTVKGYVFPFLVAAFITLWAVFGEIWTIWLLIEELGKDSGFTGLAVDIVKGMLLLAAAAMIPYTMIKVDLTVSKKPTPVKLASGAFAAPAGEKLRPVSLL